MGKLMLSLALVAAFAVCMIAPITAAQAQAPRTWVSGVGDDVNPCSRTAPCKTFAGAISKTAVNGEINCLDPGGFGAVTITKSITIDCHEIFASILNAGTNGININFDSFVAGRKTVRLRNLNINGVDTGINGIRILGTASPDSEVIIEDTLIDGNFGGAGRGVSDERSGGGELTITNSTIRNMAGIGLAINGGAIVQALFDGVRVNNCQNGIAVASGGRLAINNSAVFGNQLSGLVVGAGAEVNVDNGVLSSNATGVQNNGGIVRLANSDIAFNATAITGTTQSFGNNRITGNTAVGTAPTLIAPNNTNPSGQK